MRHVAEVYVRIWIVSARHSACPAKRPVFSFADENGRHGTDQANNRCCAARDRCLQGGITGRRGAEEAFICVFAPGWLDHFIYDEHYGRREGIRVRSGRCDARGISRRRRRRVRLRIDDPGVVTSWDMIKPEPKCSRRHRRYLRSASCASRMTRFPEFPRIACVTIFLRQLARRAHS